MRFNIDVRLCLFEDVIPSFKISSLGKPHAVSSTINETFPTGLRLLVGVYS